MNQSKTWSTSPDNKVTQIKALLSQLSMKVRGDQLGIFIQKFKPKPNHKILDVGLSPEEKLIDTNYFEKFYPYPKSITGASVEDCSNLKKKYPQIKIVRVWPNRKLPFKDNQFDIATAWATLEHVGGYKEQEFFINELLRVGKKVFITTPYRGCFYEPHSGLPFLHWLPLSWFRLICSRTSRDFWSKEGNLNPLFVGDIKKMNISQKLYINIYNTIRLIPSHLIISNVPI